MTTDTSMGIGLFCSKSAWDLRTQKAKCHQVIISVHDFTVLIYRWLLGGELLSLVPRDAKGSSSEELLMSVSICNVIHVGEMGGGSLWKVPKTAIVGPQCCVAGQSWMVGFLRWLKPPSEIISFWPHPEPALGFEPSLALLPSGLMTISGVQARAGAWPARPSRPVPFSSWAWIPPNQGLT